MKDATLGQAGKILDVFDNTPKDQIQEVLASGLLADLRDGNIAGVNREDFRRILGLNSLSLLELVGTVNVPATTEKFVVLDYILKLRKKRNVYTGSNFENWFFNKTVEPISQSVLNCHKLRKGSVDGPIITELGGEAKAETTLAEMFALMEMQANGEDGALLTNGYANIFYIRDINGVLCAVFCFWLGNSWDVLADSVVPPGVWLGGRQVFSRNSSKT